jgi:hypothetical protein
MWTLIYWSNVAVMWLSILFGPFITWSPPLNINVEEVGSLWGVAICGGFLFQTFASDTWLFFTLNTCAGPGMILNKIILNRPDPTILNDRHNQVVLTVWQTIRWAAAMIGSSLFCAQLLPFLLPFIPQTTLTVSYATAIGAIVVSVVETHLVFHVRFILWLTTVNHTAKLSAILLALTSVIAGLVCLATLYFSPTAAAVAHLSLLSLDF